MMAFRRFTNSIGGLALRNGRHCTSRVMSSLSSTTFHCATATSMFSTNSITSMSALNSFAITTDGSSRRRAIAINSDHHRYFHATRSQFAEEAPAKEVDGASTAPTSSRPAASPKVEELFQKIIWLDMVEVHLLTELINEKIGLKISDAEKERIMRGGGGRGGGDGGEAKEEEAPVEEKTIFDLKLMGFDSKSKIKVIKEVRAITALGLKEAKELVEGVPATVKKQIKKEEAEELKKKLEEVGATVEIQ